MERADATGHESSDGTGRPDDARVRRIIDASVRAAHAETERQRRLYEAVLTTTPDLVYVFDLEHRFIYANDGLLRMWGRTWDEAIGKNCLELGYEPWHAEMHDREIDQVVATKRPIRGKVPFSGAFGRRIYDYIFTPVLGTDGQVEAVAGTTRDVTDASRVEETLRASEVRQACLVQLADAIRPLTDPVAVQAAAARVLGERLGADRVAYFEVRDGHYVVERDYAPTAPSVAGRYPVGAFGTTLLDAHRAGRTVVSTDVAADTALTPAERAAYTGLGIGAYVTVPLLKDDQFVAGLVVHATTPRAWTGDEIALVEDVAERTWASVARARSEARLRESEQQYRTLFDTMDEGFCVAEMEFDAAGRAVDYRIVEMNPAFERHTGLRGVLGKSIRAAVPQLEEFWFETYGRVASTGEPAQFVHQAEPMGGRWFEVNTFRLGGDGSNRVAILFTDVTARYLGEQALRDSEAHFRSMADNAPTMLWVTDPNGACTYLSERWYAFTGRTPEQDLGFGWLENTHPDDRDRATAVFLDATDRQVPFSMEYRLRRADGEYRWAVDDGRPRFDESGRFQGFVGAVTDVHERRMAEDALREAESRFRRLADNSPVLIWQADESGTTFVNRHYRHFFAAPDGAIGTMDWAESLHPDDAARCLAAYRTAFEHRTDYEYQCRFCRRDGEYRWLQTVGTPHYTADGEFVGVICCSLDVTDIRLAAEALVDADRRKDEFLATLAHELRNPLAPLRNGLQIMKLSATAGGPSETVRGMMERQVSQMARLIDDLMDVSRISRGKIVLQTSRMTLAEAVQDAVETARPLIEERGHDLVLDVPRESIHLQADRTRLAQVFGNLLTNAAKYTPRGGRIRLAIREEDRHVVVSVEDNGVGIPAHMLTRVFDLFTQVEERSAEKLPGGLGIGLNIARQLVEMHDGSIVAESGGEGMGSRFVVRLPTVSPATAPPSADGAAAAPPVRGRRILVADDNVDSATSLATMLRIMGHETEMAHDGLEAVAMAEAFAPDVILMDIGMPNLNGFDACRRIRARASGRAMVIVAQTGWGHENDKRRATEAGFDAHVTKPVDPAVLARMVARMTNTTS